MRHAFVVLSPPVLKLMSILVQTLPTLASDGIKHVMKQLLCYLRAFISINSMAVAGFIV